MATLFAAVVTACSPAAIVPSTPQACPAALLGPVTLLLAEDGTSTVGLPEGAVAVPLRWPDGYGLKPAPGGGEVVNERGESVAMIGNACSSVADLRPTTPSSGMRRRHA